MDEPLILNLGSGEQRTLKSIVEYARERFSPEMRIIYGDSREYEVSGFVADYSKASSEISWEPSIPFEIGFERYLNFMKEKENLKESSLIK